MGEVMQDRLTDRQEDGWMDGWIKRIRMGQDGSAAMMTCSCCMSPSPSPTDSTHQSCLLARRYQHLVCPLAACVSIPSSSVVVAAAIVLGAASVLPYSILNHLNSVPVDLRPSPPLWSGWWVGLVLMQGHGR